MSQKHFILAAAPITLAAAILRLTMLSSIPPGLHFDEAANGIIVRSIAFGDYRPIFITSFTGKEVLWFYLAALVMRLTGTAVFSLRLTSVFIGMLTIATTGWLIRILYRADPRRDRLALLTMSVLAVAFWYAVLNRLAFRANSQPLMQALSLGLLWKGLYCPTGQVYRLTGRRLAILVLAGVATGLAAYTYLAVRLFTLVLALLILAVLLADRGRGQRLVGLSAYGLAALLVFAPLGLFFVNNPALFSSRIEQVAPSSMTQVWDGWRAALNMFFLAGDPLWRFNLPGKPLFGPALGLFFVVGLGAVGWDTVRSATGLQRARGIVLLAWPLIMLAPTALAIEGIAPSNLRAVGLVPLIALYPALGIVAVIDRLRLGLHLVKAVHRVALPLSLSLVILLGGAVTLYDVHRWGHTPILYYDNDGHVAAMATYLNAANRPQGAIYAATYHLHHPTLAFLVDDYGAVRSLFGGKALVLAASGKTKTLALYARDALPPDDWLERLAPYQVAAPPGPDGSPDFYAYLLPEQFDLGGSPTPPYNFANLIRLEGAELFPARSGEQAQVDLVWRILAYADQPDYAFIAEVCDQWGWCWLKANRDGTLERGQNDTYSSTQWAPGEKLLTRLSIPLPQGMPPGEYTVRVSIFSATGNINLPLLDEAGRFAGLYADVAPLIVEANTAPQPDEIPIQHRLMRRMAPFLTLVGYDCPDQTLLPGERLNLALYWLSEGAQPRDYSVKLALDDGTILYQGAPVHGIYPISDWQANELVADRYALRLSRDITPGRYMLTLRLGESEPVVLGPLTVEAIARRFEIPEDISQLDSPVVFGEQIALVGHALNELLLPGQTFTIRLAWRAEAEMETSYTFFIHLVDEQGVVIAQLDGPPHVEGRPYPTDLWLPGEIVVSEHALVIPNTISAGIYMIRVGIYLLEDGQHLSLPGSSDDAFTLPVTVTISQH